MSRLPIDVPDLPAELSSLLEQIPTGLVTTYGDLARALGDVRAARWVGEYLLAHPHTTACPCHRVVRKDGDVGLFITRDVGDKISRLTADGVCVSNGRVPLDRFGFADFKSAAPLTTLRNVQLRLPDQVAIRPADRPIRSVGGIDVSYVSPDWGIAAYVRIDVVSQEVLWSTTIGGPVPFPYIPNYLTFRELPLFAKLFDEVRRCDQEAAVTIVDGNGILHPRRAGSASALGVAVGTPTVGVGKKLLCGYVELADLNSHQPREVVHEGEVIGFAMKSGDRSRPFFASPGHQIDQAGAVEVVKATLPRGTGRLPTPIALADRLSRQEASQFKSKRTDLFSRCISGK